MIVRDEFVASWRGKATACAHLMSDLPDPARARAELVAFATSIGLREEWIQHEGTPKEHFDLLGRARIKAAERAGAKRVTGREIVWIVRARRAAGGGNAR